MAKNLQELENELYEAFNIALRVGKELTASYCTDKTPGVTCFEKAARIAEAITKVNREREQKESGPHSIIKKGN